MGGAALTPLPSLATMSYFLSTCFSISSLILRERGWRGAGASAAGVEEEDAPAGRWTAGAAAAALRRSQAARAGVRGCPNKRRARNRRRLSVLRAQAGGGARPPYPGLADPRGLPTPKQPQRDPPAPQPAPGDTLLLVLLNQTARRMIIPVRCFTCGKVRAPPRPRRPRNDGTPLASPPRHSSLTTPRVAPPTHPASPPRR